MALEQKPNTPSLLFPCPAPHPQLQHPPWLFLLFKAAILPLTHQPKLPMVTRPSTPPALYTSTKDIHPLFQHLKLKLEGEGKCAHVPPNSKQNNVLPLLDLSPLKGSHSFTNGWPELHALGACKPLFFCSGYRTFPWASYEECDPNVLYQCWQKSKCEREL